MFKANVCREDKTFYNLFRTKETLYFSNIFVDYKVIKNGLVYHHHTAWRRGVSDEVLQTTGPLSVTRYDDQGW
jgi:hypothetical protein